MAFDFETWGKLGLAAYQAYSSNQAGKEEQQGLKDARNATNSSSADAIAELRRQNLQARSDLAPYNAGGQSAFNAYLRTLGIAPSPTTAGSGGLGGVGGGTSTPGVRFPGATPEKPLDGTAGTVGGLIGMYFGGEAGGAAGKFIGDGAERNGYNVKALVDPTGNSGSFFTQKSGNKYLNALVEPNVHNLGRILPWGDKLFGSGGDLATGSRVFASKNGVFFDQNGAVIARVAKPASGMVKIPGLSRNGHDVFLTSEGKVVKQQQNGGGFDDLGFSLDSNAKDGPAEVNGVIGKGYNPGVATEADYGLSPVETGSASGFTPTAAPTGNVNEDRYGGFYESPGYKFLFDETMRGGRAAGSARGGLYSGRLIKELERRAAGIASQDFGSYQDNLYRASELGQSAAAGRASSSDSLGANVANIITGQGDALSNLAIASGSSRASSIATNAGNLGDLAGRAIDAFGNRTTTQSTTANPLQQYIDSGSLYQNRNSSVA